MPQYFKESLNTRFAQATIEEYLKVTNVTSLACYPRLRNILTINELIETERSIIMLTKYLLENKKFDFPSSANEGKIYRAGKLNSGDAGNGYFPISKSTASNCPTPGEPQEPIWFSLEPLYRYLNLTPQEPNGIVSCRKIKDIGNDLDTGRQGEKKFNMVINLSTKMAVGDGYLLSKSLQTAINRAILIQIVRQYCYAYTLVNYPGDLTYDYIITNASRINLTGTVNGYNCDTSRYTGGTIETLLQSWSYLDGTRRSTYNQDRIQIQVLFEIFEYVQAIINQLQANIFKKSFIESVKTAIPEVTYATKFNLLGWVCGNVPRGRDNSIFPGEYALSMKYFAKPIRYQIFDKQRENCKPRFFVYNPNNGDGYQEVAGPPGVPPLAPNPFAPNVGFLNPRQPQAPNIFAPRPPAVNPFAANQLFGANIVLPPARWKRGGGVEEEEEYFYSKEPEIPNNDLFQVFFASSPEEEEKYTDEPEGVAEIIKKYGEEQEKQRSTKSNEINSKLIARGTGSTIRPQPSIRTQGGKLSKKHKRKSFKKKISKKYKKRYTKKIKRKFY